MTPKEQAEALYWKFYQRVADGPTPEDNARTCALICVDTVLEAIDMPLALDYAMTKEQIDHEYKTGLKQTEYWTKVREHINGTT